MKLAFSEKKNEKAKIQKQKISNFYLLLLINTMFTLFASKSVPSNEDVLKNLSINKIKRLHLGNEYDDIQVANFPHVWFVNSTARDTDAFSTLLLQVLFTSDFTKSYPKEHYDIIYDTLKTAHKILSDGNKLRGRVEGSKNKSVKLLEPIEDEEYGFKPIY